MKNSLIIPSTTGLFLAMLYTYQVMAASDAATQPVSAIKQMTVNSVKPASDAVFTVANEAPGDISGWIAVESNALALAGLGKQLLKIAPANSDEWIKQSRLLIDAASEAAAAAKVHDADSVSEIGDKIYGSCAACHTAYPVKPANK